jgi:hypothetical protein
MHASPDSVHYPGKHATIASRSNPLLVRERPALNIANLSDALILLKDAGAPSRLLRHAEVVAEVAAEVADAVAALGVGLDRGEVVVGAALHDAGKIVCPGELTGPGREHEAEGEALLLERGVSPRLARFCRTHGLPPGEMPVLEDLVVAVADKLWRGVRNEAAELALVDAVARRIGTDRWDVFTPLDDRFERIAAGGEARLARQREA